MDLTQLSISEISNLVKTKKISVVELVKHYSDRINQYNKTLNAFISIDETAIKQAQIIDEKIAQGHEVGPLAGVPFGIKDLLCTKGLKTTAASKMLNDFVPPYDATVVQRLKSAGAVVMGKTNLDEFAMGSSNESSHFGPVKNPWNTKYVPGGSSGGSAAAQSARLVAATIGTDTGGSIRQPSSYCGIVGIKPTYGRVSRYGIVAYASSLDQAGPMVSTVADAAIILEVICGQDERDGTTSDLPVPQFSKNLNKSMKGIKIGILKEYMSGAIDSQIVAAVEETKKYLISEGAEIIEVSVPLTEYSVPVYYLTSASEASSNLARYDGVRYGHRSRFENLSAMSLERFYSQTRGEGFGKEVKRRIMLGTYCLSSGYYDAFYNKACQVRRMLRQQFIEAFSKCDVILSPVTTSPAFELGKKSSDPLAMYLNDIFTVSTNLAGLPGMSVPVKLSAEGLPIGVQLTAGHFQEQKLLNVALAIESQAQMKGRMPHGL